MKFFKVLFVALVIIFGTTLTAAYFWLKTNSTGQLFFDIGKTAGISGADFTVIKQALGFDSPKTYLLLFLNNTELRPGGGFIGAYAIVRFDKAVPEIIKLEGSEILDKEAAAFIDNPPQPISRWLKTKHWYFRDGNWSPDFAESSRQALAMYQKENGIAAADIDGVVGFTPTVVEELLKIIGPIKAEGMEFGASNFIEKLEYEVEYGYVNRGETVSNRKNLMRDVAEALIAEVKKDIFTNWSKYLALGREMLEAKQVAAYAVDPTTQDILRQKNWSGEMSAYGGDYLIWVDANLGALKTDAAIARGLAYKITPTTSGYLASASMNYVHTGKYDWRTSRYLAYARVFVPAGTELVKTLGAVQSDKEGALSVGQGAENGKQWFGAYLNIAPGDTGTLTFEYLLPENVARQIADKEYNLLVQKQIGTNNVGLNLNLDFGKEVINLDGLVVDKYFTVKDLDIDREFKIKFN